MSKYLILSVLTAWAFGAQALESFSVTYTANISNIQDAGKETGTSGTLPGVITMSLIDTGFATDKTIYSTTFTFDGLEVETDHGETITLGKGGAYIREDGRFDIASFVSDFTGGTAYLPKTDLVSSKPMLTFAYDEQTGGFGVSATFEGKLSSLNVYENCEGMDDDAMILYANKNMKTVFEVSDLSYELAIDAGNDKKTLTSSTDMGTLKPITPVPEPTSGLLLMMGLAGLALKRKQAK